MRQWNTMASRAAALLFGMLLGGLPAFAATAGGGYAGHRVVAGDFNGDGWADFILQPLAGYHGAGEFITYAAGNFGAPLATWSDRSRGTDWNAGAHRIVVGDWNGDGRDDLILQGAAGLASQQYLAAADGNFPQATRTLPATLGGLDPSQATHGLIVGDFDGDGRMDLLLQANTFVGSEGIALAGEDGTFGTLASSWTDGTLGFSWSADRAALNAGDFDGDGRAEVLVRSAVADTNVTCCRIVGFDARQRPQRVRQSWNAGWLGIDWQPATQLVIAADVNGDGQADLIVQPRAPGGDLYVLLAGEDGRFSGIADQWPSERDGVDWSAESYLLVPENAAPGEGATLAMIPEQAGLAYMRARFDASGRLQSVAALDPPPADALAAVAGGDAGGGGVAPLIAGGGVEPDADAPAGAAAGAMAGSAQVANGAAGYSIPIEVPPGRAGMAPSLSLSYASNGGDGHEGVGWSLGGFSAIYRCPATQASDGVTRGTTFGASDRYCLDGAKLMLFSGSQGAAGSVYHAEVNGFSKVAAVGETAGATGPQSFTITTAGGDMLYYGTTAGSRLTAPNGAVFTWALAKRVDRDGNEVDYQYANVGGEYYPDEIDYTLQNGSVTGAKRRVVFGWESRTSAGAQNIVHYLTGMMLKTTVLLTHIQTWVGDAQVRDYALGYTPSAATNRPLLASVQECAFDASGTEHCFNPATFGYQGQHAPQFAPSSATQIGISVQQDWRCRIRTSANTPFLKSYDTTGDGLVDLVSAYVGLGVNADIDYSIQNGQFREPGSSTPYFAAPAPLTSSLYVTVPIDFNLDGRTDFFLGNPPDGADINFTYTTDGGIQWLQQDAGIQMPAGTPLSVLDNGLQPVVVGDVNGDGRPDLILSWHDNAGGGDGTYYLRPYFERALVDTPLYAAGSYTFSSTTVITSEQVFDYDADGKSDILIRYKGSDHYTLLHSLGDHFEEIQTNVPAVTNSSDTNLVVPVFLADVNGDSLPDIVEAKPVNGVWHWMVYSNKGTSDGQFGAIDTGIPVASTTNDGDHGLGTRYYLYDFVRPIRDPSGRTDLLIPTARTYYAYLLDPFCRGGDGHQCGTGYWEQVGPCGGYDVRRSRAPGGGDAYDWRLYRADGSNSGFGFSDFGQVAHDIGPGPTLDFNHDGLPDVTGVTVAVSPSTVSRSLKAFQFSFAGGATDGAGPMPDLLAGSDNGSGVTASFGYQPIADPEVYRRAPNGATTYPSMLFQSTMQVVAAMMVKNPVGGTNEYDYIYKDARYDVAGRGFLGFAEIDSTNERRGTTTVTDYAQGFPYIGRVTQSATTVSGETTPFATANTTWANQAYGASGVRRYVVYAAASAQTQYDPAAQYVQITHTAATQGVPDACGNAAGATQTTSTRQATQVTATTNTYNGGDPDNCRQDTLHTQDVSTTTSYTRQPATSDTLTVTTTYGYDGKAHVTSKDVSATHNGHTDARHWTYGYDAWGNRTSVKQSADGSSRTVTSDYSAWDGYFPGTVTNALGQSASFLYDEATGNKTRATDANGNWESYAWDVFGRTAGGHKQGESAVAIAYDNASAANCPGIPEIANDTAYVVYRTQAGYPDSYTCLDAFGHVLRTATQGFAAGAWIYADGTWDELGRALTESVPHYSTVSSPPKTQYEAYDVLDRPTQTIAPAANGDTRTVSMSYAGLKISYEDTDDATGVTHHYTHDYDGLGKGNGKLVQVDQEDDAGAWLTATYRYDAGGNLTRATDPLGNAITATYDGYGDKLALADPDKGNWSYAWDGYGEQLSATDAMGHTITTAWDALGRKTSESDPADARLVTTTYDTAPHGIGKPARETVAVNGVETYTRAYEYDLYGRAAGTDVATGGLTYHTGVGYDTYGRAATQTYPAMNGGADSPPTADAAANPPGPVASGTSVSLTATASDPDGDPLTYRWAQAASDPIRVAIANAASAQASVTLAQAGSYHFTVTVSDGELDAQASVAVQAEVAPTASATPTVDPATSYTGAFSVAWNPIAGATSYELQESKNAGAWTTPSDSAATSYAASGRGAGSYRYQVRGYNAVGYGPWGGSATETVVAPPPPQAPLLSPNPSPNGAWTVQWGEVADATNYQLQELAPNGAWSTVQDGAALGWTTSGRSDGSYSYHARSCNAVTGCGAWSAEATETAAWIPATPANFHHVTPPILVHAGDAYTLAWEAAAHASSYQLALNGTSPTQIGITATSKQVTAPAAGDEDLYWRLRACGAGGCSAWSAQVHVYVAPADPPPCQNPPCINPKFVQGGGAASSPLAGEGGGEGPDTSVGGAAGAASPDLTVAPEVLAPGGTGALTVATGYTTATGYPETLTRADGTTYATITTMDAWGHATQVTEANGVTLTRGYDPATGLGTSVLAAGHDHTGLAQLVMHWDGFGNLAERDDSLNGSTETATYDDLNRLHTTNLSYSGGTLARSFAYDATGNRTQACVGGDCTAYGYGMGHGLLPHAVTSVNGDTSDYAYDANGEMTSDADRSLTWSAFGKAATITQGSYRVSLAYGPDNARTRKTLASGHVTTETVTYLGAAEVLTVNNNTSIRRTLALADVAIIDTGGYGAKLLYPITDHLGSTVALSDGSGDLAAQAMAYGPFGQRRTAGWAQAMPLSTALSINENYTDKGYTGQEELDAVGLVNYNARLYDPALGRFLSVDPLIAHPGSTQSINPYSYVENNPLNKTDPTGMCASASHIQSICDSGGSWSDFHNSVSGADWNVTAKYSNGTSITGSIKQMAGTSLSQLNQIANSLPGGSSLSFDSNGAASITSPNATNNIGTHQITDNRGDSLASNGQGADAYGFTPIYPNERQGIDPVCFACWFLGGGTGAGIKAAVTVGVRIAGKEALEVGAGAALKEAAKLGKLGERAVGDIGKKARVFINGRWRIPDGIDTVRKTLSEVKNVRSQSYTRQLRDYLDYAQKENLRFDLYLRSDTKVYRPLQQDIDKALIRRLDIPPW